MAQRLTRTESREQTRRRLLEAAAVLFAQKGYQGTSVDDVAESAGYSKGALYYNFETKDELFKALVDENITRMISGLEAALEGAPTIEAKLEALQGVLTAGERRRGGEHLWFEVLTQARRDDKLKRTVGKAYQRMSGAIADLIEQQFEEAGVRPPLPPADLATAIIVVWMGHGTMRLLDSKAVEPGLVPSILALLLRP
jgi:AcrR family transcriptional regulator